MEINLFYASKRNCLGITLTKKENDFWAENYKKKMLNKIKDLSGETSQVHIP